MRFSRSLVFIAGCLAVTLIWGNLSQGRANISAISWTTNQSIDFEKWVVSGTPFSVGLQQFFDQYAAQPNSFQIDPILSQQLFPSYLKATTPEVAFHWMLSHYELALVHYEQVWNVIPRTEVWRRTPYRKQLAASVSVDAILEDLSVVGQIPIIRDQKVWRAVMVHRNFKFLSVEKAVNELALQFGWFVEYDATTHTLQIIEEQAIEVRTIPLAHINHSELKDFLQKSRPLLRQLQRLEIFYPSENTVVLRGRTVVLDAIIPVITDLDRSQQAEPEVTLPTILTPEVISNQKISPTEMKDASNIRTPLEHKTSQAKQEDETSSFQKIEKTTVPPAEVTEPILETERSAVARRSAETDRSAESEPALEEPSIEADSTIASPPHFETIFLKAASLKQVQQHLFPVLQQDLELTRDVHIHWQKDVSESSKSPSIVSLYGPEKNVIRLVAMIDKIDRSYAQYRPTEIQRIPLNYLHVGEKRFVSDGEAVSVPGVEVAIQNLLQPASNFEDEAIPKTEFHILADVLNNALIVQGEPQQIETMQQVLKTWDQPNPLIRIEAHIFETSDVTSRQLGLQFQGQGIARGDVISNPAVEPFSATAIFGPVETTRAFQVDALLRLMETEGKGRVLSRPVVVTTNNIEAEMRSGDIINVKVVVEEKPTLKEIKTGVTLRVTPRLVVDRQSGKPDYKIRLNIFAESSSPITDALTDGVPQINSQSARSDVVVRDGQPFLLGGLIRQNSSLSTQGVPLLQNIPVLGYFFKTENQSKRFNHIMVFVTPTLISLDHEQSLPIIPELENASQIETFGNTKDR